MTAQLVLLQAVLLALAVPVAGAARAPAAGPTAGRLIVVPQSHIDVAWLWRYDPETIDACCRVTFSRALAIMDAIPGYTFAQSQVPLYEPLARRWPAIDEGIRRRVREGRWEVVGGHYVEFEGAGPDGESLVRQCLYGRRAFRSLLGADVRTAWQEDAWTHPWTLPQILLKSGMDTYMFKRGAPGERLFWWEGPDGSRVLAYCPIRTSHPDPDRWKAFFADMRARYGTDLALVRLGSGDHGGGPALDDARRIEAMRPLDGIAVSFGRFDAFAREIRRRARRIPVVRGELGFDYEGGYTTCGAIKDGNRRSEILVLALEKLAAVASLEGLRPYPTEAIHGIWRRILFNQFHDILAGCVIPPAREDALRLYREAVAIAEREIRVRLEALAGRAARGDGAAILLFNPLSWPRTDPVEVVLPGVEPGASIELGGPEGARAPLQILGPAPGGLRVLFLAPDVPPIGVARWTIRPAGPAASSQGAAASSQGPAASGGLRATPEGLENRFFRIAIDRATGDLASIFDKGLGREILAEGERGNRIDVLEDEGDSEGKIRLTGKATPLDPNPAIRVVERGPVRATVRIRSRIGAWHTVFVRDVSLYADLSRIDLRLSIEWNRSGRFVKIAFPLAIPNGTATFEIPYGTVVRERDGAERPAIRWVDLSGRAWGVSLVNANRYGYDVRGATIRLSALRSPTHPAHNVDDGIHDVRYALLPHGGDWRAGDVVRRAYRFNVPVFALAVPGAASRPATRSYFAAEPATAILSAVKRPEEGEEGAGEWILRLVESQGRPARATVRLPAAAASVRETNLLEEEGRPIEAGGTAIDVSLGPYEIKTLKVRLAP